jgi:hypothetical protein
VLAAAAAPALVAAALAPLASAQHGHGGASAVSADPLGERIADTARRFLTGEYGGPVGGLTQLAGLLALAAVVLLIVRGSPRARRRAAMAGALAALALLLPLSAALVGVDYFTSRYPLAAWLPLALVCAAGLDTPGRAGTLVAAALCALLLFISAAIPLDEGLQRDDWRSLAARLDAPAAQRAILVQPYPGLVPLGFYLEDARRLPAGGAAVSEVALVSASRDPADAVVRPPAPGFREVERVRRPSYTLVRYRSPRAVRLGRAELAQALPAGGRFAALLQRPG